MSITWLAATAFLAVTAANASPEPGTQPSDAISPNSSATLAHEDRALQALLAKLDSLSASADRVWPASPEFQNPLCGSVRGALQRTDDLLLKVYGSVSVAEQMETNQDAAKASVVVAGNAQAALAQLDALRFALVQWRGCPRWSPDEVAAAGAIEAWSQEAEPSLTGIKNEALTLMRTSESSTR
jgi:hypothetical protein